MRFEITESAQSDFDGLNDEHKRLFMDCVRDKFSPACDAWSDDPQTPWPKSLRVETLRGTRGQIRAMTWSFSGPDGRATFEWAQVDLGDGTFALAVRWRRIGDHRIYRDP